MKRQLYGLLTYVLFCIGLLHVDIGHAQTAGQFGHELADGQTYNVRIMVNDVITDGTVTGVANGIPTVTGTLSISCADNRLRSTTNLVNNTRPAVSSFVGVHYLVCALTPTGTAVDVNDTAIVILPSGGGPDGNTVLVKTTGTCTGLTYQEVIRTDLPEIAADGSFTYALTAPTSDCPNGELKTTEVPTGATVTFTTGELKPELANFAVAGTKKNEHAWGSGETAYGTTVTFNIGMNNPKANYYTACDKCFGAMKIVWSTGHTQRAAGFTVPTANHNIPVTRITLSQPTTAQSELLVFRTALAAELYNIDPVYVDTYTTARSLDLLDGTIKCDDNGGTTTIPAYEGYSVATARDACRAELAHEVTVTCPTGQTRGTNDYVQGTVTVEGTDMTYHWNVLILDQYDGKVATTYVKNITVPFSRYGHSEYVTWADDTSAVVTNNFNLSSQTEYVSTERTVNLLTRPACAIDATAVSNVYQVRFTPEFTYAEAPTIGMGTYQRNQKYNVSNMLDGASIVGADFCLSGDDTYTDCSSLTKTSTTGFVRMPDFHGCRGMDTEGKVGGLVQVTHPTSGYKYLPSPVTCVAAATVRIADINLNWKIDYVASAFDASNKINRDGGVSTLSGYTGVPAVVMAPSDLCTPEGTATTSATVDCNNWILDKTFAQLQDQFTDCGVGTTMFVTQSVVFTNDVDSADVLTFCSTKQLSYSEGVQNGVVVAAFTMAARVGYDASAQLQSYNWERCVADPSLMKQVMKVDITHTFTSVVFNMVSNDILQYDSTASDLANSGLLVLSSSCTDVCTDPDQFNQSTFTSFNIGDGSSSSDFTINSQMQGNPCEESQSLADVPTLRLQIEKAGLTSETPSCATTAVGLSADPTISEEDTVCFHLDDEYTAHATDAVLSAVTWSLSSSTGNSRSAYGDVVNGTNWHATAKYDVTNADVGSTITVYAMYTQGHSGGRRRLRAEFVLGVKDSGESDISFTVLPAHISIVDQVDGISANESSLNTPIPSNDETSDNLMSVAVWGSIAVAALGIGVVAWCNGLGSCKALCDCSNKKSKNGKDPAGGSNAGKSTSSLDWRYSRVNRFDNKLKY